MDRNTFLHVFDRLGRCFLSLTWYLIRFAFRFVQLDNLLAFHSGLACRPADLYFALFLWSLFFEGLQSWLGGLASLALWFGSGFCLVVLLLAQL